jgi:murein DD-endopeptidase MepM/ murein hydrolase activator NlpD
MFRHLFGMHLTSLSKVQLVHLIKQRFDRIGGVGAVALSLSLAAMSLGIAEAAAHTGFAAPPLSAEGVQLTAIAAPPAATVQVEDAGPAWEGRDIDGDGAPDFANPTGAAPRGHDAYGDGWFHARRDGGSRPHEGVDYDSRAGQQVVAPISGYVSKIGYAYPGDERFRYVEIDNPALRLQARVFYVDPQVSVGQAVELGRPIGAAHSLQARYGGITDHIHLELERAGRKIDAQTVILARAGGGASLAAMN